MWGEQDEVGARFGSYRPSALKQATPTEARLEDHSCVYCGRMKIVHTSDWHAGRVWKGVNRLPELGNVLEHLGDFLEAERVDLLLMSGDVFDSGSPNAEAESWFSASSKEWAGPERKAS
jgi:hypothetical protein